MRSLRTAGRRTRETTFVGLGAGAVFVIDLVDAGLLRFPLRSVYKMSSKTNGLAEKSQTGSGNITVFGSGGLPPENSVNRIES